MKEFDDTAGVKVCRGCKCLLPLIDFTKSKYGRNGYFAQCRRCVSKTRTKFKDKCVVENKCPNCGGYSFMGRICYDCSKKRYAMAKTREFRKAGDDLVKYRLGRLCHASKSRAKKHGWKFDLDIDFLMQLYELQDGKCAITNNKLTFLPIGSANIKDIQGGNNASIDRIDSDGGYTKDNVWLITQRMNVIKSIGTWKDFMQIASALERRMFEYAKDGDMYYDHGDGKTFFDNEEEYMKWMAKRTEMMMP